MRHPVLARVAASVSSLTDEQALPLAGGHIRASERRQIYDSFRRAGSVFGIELFVKSLRILSHDSLRHQGGCGLFWSS